MAGTLPSPAFNVVNANNITTSGLIVNGNLSVTGTTTTFNSVQTSLYDPVVTLGSNSTSTNDGKERGVEFKYGNGSAIVSGFFGYDTAGGQFVFLTNTSNTSEVITGTIGNIAANVTGSATTAAKLTTARNISYTGDASGSFSFDGSANASTTLTLATTAVTAGSYGSTTSVGTFTVDTKGRLTSAASSAIAFPVTSVAGKNGAVTIASADITDATNTNTASTIVKRDSSGNFVAGTITAALAGNATTATTAAAITTARTISYTGDAAGSVSFDGSANVSTALTLASTAVTAGSYGTATSVGTFTVDAKGRLTSAASTAITFPVTSVFGRTGAVTLANADITTALGYTPVNPNNAVTLSSDLTVTGNLTISGTTTTVNSTQTTLVDPVITLGSNSTTTNDGKDRGIEFKYGTGSAIASGFFGYDTSAARYVLLTATSNTSEVITGTTASLAANLIGNSSTASTLATARTISVTGDATWSTSFDGSANVSAAITLASTAVTAGSYGSTTSVGTFTVDAKGRLTAATSAAIAFPVTSVAGKTGAVTLVSADITDIATKYANTGANSNITSLTGLTTALSQGQGGTGATTLGAASVTPTGGTATTLASILVSLDTTAPGFNAAYNNLITQAFAALPTSLPAGNGVVWNNGGVISIS